MAIDETVQSKRLSVEVEEGFLFAKEEGVEGPPLIFGRLLQPVVASELMWGVDDAADGEGRALCIELPKKAAPGGVGASVDCVFDETLHVHGEPCLLPGLSLGTITLTLPKDVDGPTSMPSYSRPVTSDDKTPLRPGSCPSTDEA